MLNKQQREFLKEQKSERNKLKSREKKVEKKTETRQTTFKTLAMRDTPISAVEIRRNMDRLASSRQEQQCERKIANVLKKVVHWRGVFLHGMYRKDPKTGEIVHETYDLEEAAEQIDSSKKTLDDYLLNVRFALKFGFDFFRMQNESIGYLRNYVNSERLAIKGNLNLKWLSSRKDKDGPRGTQKMGHTGTSHDDESVDSDE